jgi:hypothetical protein
MQLSGHDGHRRWSVKRTGNVCASDAWPCSSAKILSTCAIDISFQDHCTVPEPVTSSVLTLALTIVRPFVEWIDPIGQQDHLLPSSPGDCLRGFQAAQRLPRPASCRKASWSATLERRDPAGDGRLAIRRRQVGKAVQRSHKAFRLRRSGEGERMRRPACLRAASRTTSPPSINR